MRTATPPDHHRAATEVPRPSGQPPLSPASTTTSTLSPFTPSTTSPDTPALPDRPAVTAPADRSHHRTTEGAPAPSAIQPSTRPSRRYPAADPAARQQTPRPGSRPRGQAADPAARQATPRPGSRPRGRTGRWPGVAPDRQDQRARPGRGAAPAFRSGTQVPVIPPDNPTPGLADLARLQLESFAHSTKLFLRDSGIPDPRTQARIHELDVPDVGQDPLGPTAPLMQPFTVMDDGVVTVTAALVPHGPVFPAFAYRSTRRTGQSSSPATPRRRSTSSPWRRVPTCWSTSSST
jgi:hypothetical protein